MIFKKILLLIILILIFQTSFGNLNTFNEIGPDLISQGYSVYSLELTGGPKSELYNYKFEDLAHEYFPILLAGVHSYSNADKLDLVANSNGCRVGLETLNTYSNGENNIGYIWDYQIGQWISVDLESDIVSGFYGIGCPITVNKQDFTQDIRFTSPNVVWFQETDETYGEYAYRKLKDKTHVTHQDINWEMSWFGADSWVKDYLGGSFIGDSTISENLFEYYVNLYHQNDSEFDFSNIDVDSMVLFTTPSESSWLTPQNEWEKIVEGVDMGDGQGTFLESNFKTIQKNKGVTIIVKKSDIETNKDLISLLEEHLYKDLDNSFVQTVYDTADTVEWLLIWTDVGADVVGIVKDCGLILDGTMCTISVVSLGVPFVPGKLVKEAFEPAIKYLGDDFFKILRRVDSTDMYNTVVTATKNGNLDKTLNIINNLPVEYQKDVMKHLSDKNYNENTLDGIEKLVQKEGNVFNPKQELDTLENLFETPLNSIDGVGDFIKLNKGNSKQGWQHILERHVGKSATSDFKFKKANGDYMSPVEVNNLLKEVLKKGTLKSKDGQTWISYTKDGIPYKAPINPTYNKVTSFFPEVI